MVRRGYELSLGDTQRRGGYTGSGGRERFQGQQLVDQVKPWDEFKYLRGYDAAVTRQRTEPEKHPNLK